MTSYTYQFPDIIDPDYGAKTQILSVEDSATGTLPTFITFKQKSLKINPTSISQIKTYKMSVKITDSKD